MSSTDQNLDPFLTQPANLGRDEFGVPWYRRGRFYGRTMARAAAAARTGNPGETTRLLEFADEQLWPLEALGPEHLRDFIAGINREAEEDVLAVLEAGP